MVTNRVQRAPATGPGLSVQFGVNSLHMADRVPRVPTHSPCNPYPPWEQSAKDTQSKEPAFSEHFQEGIPKSRHQNQSLKGIVVVMVANGRKNIPGKVNAVNKKYRGTKMDIRVYSPK